MKWKISSVFQMNCLTSSFTIWLSPKYNMAQKHATDWSYMLFSLETYDK